LLFLLPIFLQAFALFTSHQFCGKVGSSTGREREAGEITKEKSRTTACALRGPPFSHEENNHVDTLFKLLIGSDSKQNFLVKSESSEKLR
jgi:hypothetical protein